MFQTRERSTVSQHGMRSVNQLISTPSTVTLLLHQAAMVMKIEWAAVALLFHLEPMRMTCGSYQVTIVTRKFVGIILLTVIPLIAKEESALV